MVLYSYYNSLSWRDLAGTEAVLMHLEDPQALAEADAAFREVFPEADPAAHAAAAEAPLADSRGIPGESFDVTAYADLRIIHITGISADAERAAYRAMLYCAAIRRYAEGDEVITGTEVLGYTEPVLRTYPERKAVAAITGAIIGVLAALLVLWLRFLFDNAVYVPEDAARRYGIPVLGVLPRKGQASETYPPQFQKELMLHMRELQSFGNNWLLLRAQDTDVTNSGDGPATILREYAGEAMGPNVILTEKTTAEVNTADVILLEVRSGARLEQQYEHLIAEAAAGGNPVRGIILTGTDNGFLQKYYRF